MEHLCTEVSQIGSLAIGADLDGTSTVVDLGIRGHQTRNVFPDLNVAGIERRSEDRRRVVRALEPERRCRPVASRSDEALHDGQVIAVQVRPDDSICGGAYKIKQGRS